MAGDWTGNYTSAISTSPCLGGHCIGKGALSGVCGYTSSKYDTKSDMTFGDRTQCEDYDSPVGNSQVRCGGNGEVFLPFGSPEYIGLGFMVFATLVFVECFGSPFVRNCGVVISLMVGFIVAGIAGYTPPGSAEGAPQLRYVNADKINAAPWITFLWVETFPIHVYAPAILPVLIAFVVSTAETVGDIGATAESSRLATDSLRFDGRVQGGLLADGLGSLLAGLMMVPPNTTFSQNSGVIAITRCANKRAGYMCCFFLVLFGVIAKLAGILQSIPDCTLGGLTTFCFINVCVSGIRIFERATLGKSRNRFIVAASLALGLGVTIVPGFFMNNFITTDSDDKTLNLFLDGIKILLSTPYSIGTILALFLNGILPEDLFEANEAKPNAKTVDVSAKSDAPMAMYMGVPGNQVYGNQMPMQGSTMPMQQMYMDANVMQMDPAMQVPMQQVYMDPQQGYPQQYPQQMYPTA